MSDEGLHEHLTRLEQALAGEREHRDAADATIAGLRCIAEAKDLDATDAALCEGLRPLLQYQHATVVRRADDDARVLEAKVNGHSQLGHLRWVDGALRRRVLAGQTVALYDLHKTPELAGPLGETTLRSLLCVPLSIPGRPAILLGGHEQPAFFSSRHVVLARRFVELARCVLVSLDAREHAQQLAEERAAALARSNEALREQLETVQEQQRQIERLRAPILRVAERTLVVPLIGELDRDALAEVTESLLHAVMAHRAHTVILDLTGFESEDVAVAERIGSLARTTAMLGARCILSGMRPRTALSLSGSEVELRAFASLADALLAQEAAAAASLRASSAP